jgi:hypothetical protein
MVMSPRQLIIWALLTAGICGVYSAAAQEGAFISLNAETTTLQTGQVYEIQIVVENVVDFWATELQIGYDPTALYIIGTQSGSPVQPGALLAGRQTLVPRNRIERDALFYTVSLLAPEEPINGTGVIATFRAAPLRAGTTQLVFRQANLTAVTFQDTGSGRVAGEPQALAVTPVLLELSAQGDPVEPPSEATATPQPTSTPILAEADDESTPEAGATLANITRAPADIPAPLPDSAASQTSPVLLGVAAVMLISGMALTALLLVYLRRYRR